MVKEIYQQYLAINTPLDGMHEPEIEFCWNAILYQDALKKQPTEAKTAFKQEIMKFADKDVWTPVHMSDLTVEERKLVLTNMKSFL